MPFYVRFGSMEDLEAIASGDASVPKNVLKWKLQNEEIILAESNDELVGYLRLEYLWSQFPYIGLIIVRPEFRKLGIGKAMLRFLEDCVNKQGKTALYSSSQVNEPEPQAWHRHMGFKECGIISSINPGGIGEVIFCKKIS